MRVVAILMLLLVSTAGAITDADYSITKSKKSAAEISGMGYHGTHSARISVYPGGSSKSVPISISPTRIEALDTLKLWLHPASNRGSIELEFGLDGDSDEKSSTTDPDDASILISLASWSDGRWADTGGNSNGWREFDASESRVDIKSRDSQKSRKDVSWSEAQDILRGMDVVRVYIRLKGATKYEGVSCYVDYVRIAGEVISFEPLERDSIKKAKQSSVSPGSTITYTITYGNNLEVPADIVIREFYDQRTLFLEAYPPPDPGTNNVWTIRGLRPGEHGQITVKVKTLRGSCTAGFDGSVSGVGYASVYRRLSTEREAYYVTNSVRIDGGGINRSASATTKVRSQAGFVFEFAEHGSGSYESSDDMDYSTTSIVFQSESLANRSPVTLNLSTRAIDYNSTWGLRWSCENQKLTSYMREIYYGDFINLSGTGIMRSTRSTFESRGSVEGMADLRYMTGGSEVGTRLYGSFRLGSKGVVQKKSR
ncbi:hypothetical protein [Methanothrix sp.]|uniref:hypothetical protein n=1 Tax=Methanothrix sp. TaxID=90426 RepID=UPI003C72957B